LGLFHDIDYSIITSFLFSGKKRIKEGLWIGGILIFSNGNLSDEDFSSSSNTIGFLVDKYIIQSITARLEYQHTEGSIYSTINRQITLKPIAKLSKPKKQMNGGTANITTISDFSSNTGLAKLAFDLSGIISGLDLTPRFSYTGTSDEIKTTSTGAELSYQIAEQINISTSFIYTSDNLDKKNNYLTVGVSKIF